MRVDVNDGVYLKDPFSSALGRQIIEKSISMISEKGLECFTFKKLAVAVGSTEPAIYRYFENKHKLLLFLNLWYWRYLELNLVMGTANIADPVRQLEIAIEVLVCGPIGRQNEFIDPVALHALLVEESIKAMLTKAIESDLENGFFSSYFRIGHRIAEIIKAINPEYRFPKTLVSTVLEASLLQPYYAAHLPMMTEMPASEASRVTFFRELVLKVIQ